MAALSVENLDSDGDLLFLQTSALFEPFVYRNLRIFILGKQHAVTVVVNGSKARIFLFFLKIKSCIVIDWQ